MSRRRESVADVDRRDFEAYCVSMLAAYREHTGPGGNVWAHHTAALQRRNANRDELDVFIGAWHTVRPYVTQEFRQWIEEFYGHEPRLTFSEFVAMRRYEREQERTRERAWLESKEYCAEQLQFWREFDRDGMIAEMRNRGATFTELQAVTGMARSSLAEIIARVERRQRPQIAPEIEPATSAEIAPLRYMTLSDGSVVDLEEAF